VHCVLIEKKGQEQKEKAGKREKVERERERERDRERERERPYSLSLRERVGAFYHLDCYTCAPGMNAIQLRLGDCYIV
jgi:hypothetical protein